MAFENLEGSLKRVLAHEGGWSNHPRDPGGATMKGVTQRVYTAWRRSWKLPNRSVRLIDTGELRAIYDVNYWDKVEGDRLPSGLDHVAFDAAVNSGPSRGAKWLQVAVGTPADGVVGLATLAAAKAVAGQAAPVRKACEARRRFLRGLKTFSTFGRGWMRRVAEVEAHAVSLALLSVGTAKAAVADELQDYGQKAAAKAKSEGAKATTAAAGAGGSGAATQAEVAPVDVLASDHAILMGVLAALAVALLVTAALAWRRSRIERETSAAYAEKVHELQDA